METVRFQDLPEELCELVVSIALCNSDLLFDEESVPHAFVSISNPVDFDDQIMEVERAIELGFEAARNGLEVFRYNEDEEGTWYFAGTKDGLFEIFASILNKARKGTV